jgi:arylamine N-acetyltransferase
MPDLSPDALAHKLVRRRRGGYCYELNNLMRYVLEHLGFEVDALAARVVWMSPHGLDGPPTAEDHQALAVCIPGVDDTFLVDVGFGGQTLSSPIHLAAGPIHRTRHEPYRLRVHHQGYVLESLVRDIWQPLYTFTTGCATPDRPTGRKLVCVNVSDVFLRCRSHCGPGHRRCTVEPSRSQSRHTHPERAH